MVKTKSVLKSNKKRIVKTKTSRVNPWWNFSTTSTTTTLKPIKPMSFIDKLKAIFKRW